MESMAEPAREPDYATKADLDVLRAEVRSDLDVAVEAAARQAADRPPCVPWRG